MRISFLFYIFIAGLTTSCSCQSSNDASNANVFRYNEPAGVSSLDPAFARAQSNIWICHQLYSTLVELDSTLNVVPGLAKKWTINDAGDIYRFELLNNVLFHPHPAFNGERTLNAHDVVYSLSRLTDPALSSPGAWTMQWVESVYAESDSVVVITLNEPFSPFIRLLSMKYTSVVPQEAVEYEPVSFAEYPSGTGPFLLKRWIPGDRMILRSNQNYYLPHMDNGIESVVIRFITDKLSAFLAFIKGDIDFISGLDVSYRDDIIDEEGNLRAKYSHVMRLETTPYLNTEYLAFNTKKLVNEQSPYADVRIRKAMHMAIDKNQMVRYLLRGMATPANQGITPPALSKSTQTLVTTDLDAASKLLSDAGFPNGRGLPPITLHTNPGYQDMAEFIQSQMKQLGIEINVDVTPPATLRQQIATGKISWFRASWIADYPDIENYMLLFCSDFTPPSGPNYSRFSQPDMDALYHKLARTQRSINRDSLHQKMEQIIADKTPVIPLFYDQVIRLINPNIKGFPINALNLLDLRTVEKTNSYE